jgi:hypothetical protein
LKIVNVAVCDLLERDVGICARRTVDRRGILYFIGYLSNPAKRLPGFFIQSTATFALLLGALGRIIYLLAA